MKNLKIIISVLLALTLVICAFTACKGKGKKSSAGATATVVVTDENGEQVTDENGEFVTAVVDENGEIIEGDDSGVDVGDNNGVEIDNGGVNINSGKSSNGSSKTVKNNKAATTKKASKNVKKPSAPGKVTGLKASDITKNSLTLKWKAVSCTGYEVAYSTDSTKWTTIKKAMTETKLPVSGLTSNTKYFFRVRAFNSNSAGKSASGWAVTNATTKADESINRNIKITVKLPMDSNKTDTLRIYVDDMKNPVKEAQIKCNGTKFTWTTDKKYKGNVKVKAVLVSHKTSNTVSTDKDNCVVDISGIGIDQEVDDKEL